MRRRVLESSDTQSENVPNFSVSSDYPILNFQDFYWYFGDKLNVREGAEWIGENNYPTDISDYINFYTGGSYFALYNSLDAFENHAFSSKINIDGVIPDFPYIQGPSLGVNIEEAISPWSYIMVLELYLYTRPLDLNGSILIPIVFPTNLDLYFVRDNTYHSENSNGLQSGSDWSIKIGDSYLMAFFALIHQDTINDKDYILYSFRSITYDSSTHDQWGVGIRFHLIS